MPAKSTPNKSKSALKRVRQTEKLTLRTKSVKKHLKTLTKKIETEIAAKNTENAQNVLKQAISEIAKAASKGMLHRNTASRKISRLTKRVNSLLPSEAA